MKSNQKAISEQRAIFNKLSGVLSKSSRDLLVKKAAELHSTLKILKCKSCIDNFNFDSVLAAKVKCGFLIVDAESERNQAELTCMRALERPDGKAMNEMGEYLAIFEKGEIRLFYVLASSISD